MGLAYQEKGDLFLAVAHYRKALEFAPNFAIGHTNLGIALLLQGKKDEAIKEQREAVRLAPTLAKAHFNLGYALVSKEEIEAALLAFQEAVSLAPEWALARSCLADQFSSLRRTDEAIAEYKQATSYDSNCKQAWSGLGMHLALRAVEEKSRPAAEAAREALEQASKLDPHEHNVAEAQRIVNKMLRRRVYFRWPWQK